MGVILSGFGEGSDFGLAEIDADWMFWPASLMATFREPVSHRLRAGIVEAHAIDERLVKHGAEHARRDLAAVALDGPVDVAIVDEQIEVEIADGVRVRQVRSMITGVRAKGEPAKDDAS